MKLLLLCMLIVSFYLNSEANKIVSIDRNNPQYLKMMWNYKNSALTPYESLTKKRELFENIIETKSKDVAREFVLLGLKEVDFQIRKKAIQWLIENQEFAPEISEKVVKAIRFSAPQFIQKYHSDTQIQGIPSRVIQGLYTNGIDYIRAAQFYTKDSAEILLNFVDEDKGVTSAAIEALQEFPSSLHKLINMRLLEILDDALYNLNEISAKPHQFNINDKVELMASLSKFDYERKVIYICEAISSEKFGPDVLFKSLQLINTKYPSEKWEFTSVSGDQKINSANDETYQALPKKTSFFCRKSPF